MATIAAPNGDQVVKELNDALGRLDSGEGRVTLDFSTVHRISPAVLQALEKLAAKSEEKDAKVVLRGVPVDVYRVLKVARLAGRLAFVS